MSYKVKFNNFPIEQALLVNSGSNILFVNGLEEEFFGIYNLKINNQKVICEGKDKKNILGNISLNDNTFKNIPFLVQLTNGEPKIKINQKTLDNGFVMENIKKEVPKANSINPELAKLKNEIKILKEKLNSKEQVIIKESNDIEVHKEKLTEEFLSLNELQKHNIKKIIGSSVEQVEQNLFSKLVKEQTDGLEILRKESIEFLSEVVDTLKNKVKQITDNQKSSLQEFVGDKIQNIVEENFKIIGEKFETQDSALKTKLSKLDEVQKKSLQIINKELESLEEKNNIVLEEKMEDYKNDFLNSLNNRLSTLTENIQEKVFKENKNLLETYFYSKKEELESSVLANINEKIEVLNSYFNTNSNLLEKRIEKIIEEKSKTIKDLDKDIKKFHNKLRDLQNNTKSDKFINESKGYTDKKFNQAMEESRLYTRKILDLAGGGGAIAVQYAQGGTINGDLNVEGNMSMTTVLSGDRNLLEIFAGEGPGDTNILNAGNF